MYRNLHNWKTEREDEIYIYGLAHSLPFVFNLVVDVSHKANFGIIENLNPVVHKLTLHNVYDILNSHGLLFSESMHEHVKELKLWFLDNEYLYSKKDMLDQYLIRNFKHLQRVEYNIKHISEVRAIKFNQMIQDKISITSHQSKDNFFIKQNTNVYFALEGEVLSFRCRLLHAHLSNSVDVIEDYILFANNGINFYDVVYDPENVNQKELNFYAENKSQLEQRLLFFVENKDIIETKIDQHQFGKFLLLNIKKTTKIGLNIGAISLSTLKSLHEKLSLYFSDRPYYLPEVFLRIEIHPIHLCQSSYWEYLQSVLSLPIRKLGIFIFPDITKACTSEIYDWIISSIVNNRSIRDLKYGELPWIRNLGVEDEPLKKAYLLKMMSEEKEVSGSQGEIKKQRIEKVIFGIEVEYSYF
jgi:hypothetical protein